MLKMNNCVNLREGSNEGVDWMFPHFQAIKETSVAFIRNKRIQSCIGKAEVFKRSDTLGAPIHCGSADDMVLNPTIDVLSAITRGG